MDASALDSGRIGRATLKIIRATGIVIDQLAFVLGKSLGGLLVNIPVDGVAALVRECYVACVHAVKKPLV